MNKLIYALFSCCILTAGNQAFAMDEMSKDDMNKGAMKMDAMKMDAMKKDDMNKGAIKMDDTKKKVQKKSSKNAKEKTMKHDSMDKTDAMDGSAMGKKGM